MAGVRRDLLTLVKDAGASVGVLGGITALNADNTEQRLVNAAIRRTATDLCTAGMLIREYSFYTVSGTAVYAMPTDFFLPWPFTTWNRNDQWPMRGVSEREWQGNKSGFTASSVHQHYSIRPYTVSPTALHQTHFSQNLFYIDPTPTSAEKVAFNYRSDHWVEGLGLAATAISDITLNSTDRVVVTATSHGMVVGDVVAFYQVGGTTEITLKQFTVATADANTVSLSGTNSEDFTAWTSGGFIQKVSNTDGVTNTTGSVWYSFLPDELVELGIAWRLRQSMGLSYFDQREDYEQMKELFVGNQQGNHIINLGGARTNNYVGIPEGNFPGS